MKIQSELEQSLQDKIAVVSMTLENESYMHNVPKGSESHFKLILVSDDFVGKRLVQRHQQVYRALENEMSKIHALAMHLYTVNEWDERNKLSPSSPKCLGGE